jgi:hypothetical protein
MNRKNLTAAVFAGLAGAAGLAATAQAVNLNPDGLGQVLVYPYYTSNDGNTTLLSVVNTTEQAKAVKVRFLEGYNSREVLDFNLYLSAYDVWVAAIADSEFFGAAAGVPHLFIPDNSCTVPYLYESASTGPGLQEFLNFAYAGSNNDGGPEGIARAAEGHFEIIEMGTLVDDGEYDFATAATHQLTPAAKDKDGNVTRPATWEPYDCEALVDAWTDNFGSADGVWFDEATSGSACEPYEEDGDVSGCQAFTGTTRNSGGLFGGAAIVNPNNGTMFSYDAKAVQGYDKTDDGVHYLPGSIFPSLNSGDQQTAYVFFGVPQDRAVELFYPRSVDAVSAVFMHENIMNEYASDADLNAGTEWIVTFPTKNFYVDLPLLGQVETSTWVPVGGDACANWTAGDPYPTTKGEFGSTIDGPGPWDNIAYGWDWGECYYTQFFFDVDNDDALLPFTDTFDGEACEFAGLRTWDREERTFEPDTPGGSRPPVVSPAPPRDCDPDLEICEDTFFQLCYEVNVLRFGEEVVFGTPEIEGSSLLLEITTGLEDDAYATQSGWGRIDFGIDSDHVDFAGLVGLPVTGYAAYEIQNGYVSDDDGNTVKAYYGGLFGHKGNVRRTCAEDRLCGSFYRPISVDAN